jgi:hypothetical protein
MRLWGAYVERVDGTRGEVLLEEACRVADRLDALDALLAGTAADWVSLVEEKGSGDSVTVKIDGVLAEARQQQGILHRILTTLPMRESDDGDPADAWLAGLLSAPVQHPAGPEVSDDGPGGVPGR